MSNVSVSGVLDSWLPYSIPCYTNCSGQFQQVFVPGGTPGVTDVLLCEVTFTQNVKYEWLYLSFGQRVSQKRCSVFLEISQPSVWPSDSSNNFFTNVRCAAEQRMKNRHENDFFSSAPNKPVWIMLNPSPKSCTGPLFATQFDVQGGVGRLVVWDTSIKRDEETVEVSLGAPLSVLFLFCVSHSNIHMFAAMGSIWFICFGTRPDSNDSFLSDSWGSKSKGKNISVYSVYRCVEVWSRYI